MFNSLIMDLSDVISVNRVRVLNIDLAVFGHIFLLDPSLKSTFAPNQSCRPSLPLQLLFWPNFKLQYEILSFSRSKLGQNHSNLLPILPAPTVRRTASHPGGRHGAGDRHASAVAANLTLRVGTSLSVPEPNHCSPSPPSSSRSS